MTPRHRSFLVAAALLATSGCSIFDLSELKEGNAKDAAVPLGDGGPAADGAIDVDGSPPPPADAAGPDAFDNPNIPPGAALGSCDSSRWVASASASHPASPPVNAIDGLQPSRWSSGQPQTAGMYFQIDFGGYVMVDEAAINPVYQLDGHGDHPRGVDALVSGDGAEFDKVGGALFGDPEPGIARVMWTAHAARYLRLQLTAGSGSWWSIHDLQIGCTVPGATPDPDAGPPNPGPDGGFITERAGWTAVGTPTNVGDVATNAFDGNDATRWADGKTPQYGDEVYQLDLGAVQSVSGVQLKAVPGDYPAAYALDLSTDNSSYTEVARGLGGEVTTISFRRQDARYLRVRQIGSGWDHWWGINELNVAR
jgi:hypothetical protein